MFSKRVPYPYACSDCAGRGEVGWDPRTCPTCKGSGWDPHRDHMQWFCKTHVRHKGPPEPIKPAWKHPSLLVTRCGCSKKLDLETSPEQMTPHPVVMVPLPVKPSALAPTTTFPEEAEERKFVKQQTCIYCRVSLFREE